MCNYLITYPTTLTIYEYKVNEIANKPFYIKEHKQKYNLKDIKQISDVAMLYRYQTKRINETVSRNKERFPENFCFQLTEEEVKNLMKSSISFS